MFINAGPGGALRTFAVSLSFDADRLAQQKTCTKPQGERDSRGRHIWQGEWLCR